MAVEIHYVNVRLVWVNALGNVVDKNDPATRLNDIRLAVTQEHRIMLNANVANSAGDPTVEAYLALEASNDFAFAYMDQTQLITQKIT